MDQLPSGFLDTDLFDARSSAFQQILDEYIAPAQKFVMVVPEYNGSFPGIYKLFIDAIKPELFRGKKVAMVGVSSGRAGNLRGMDHLTGVFHYLGMFIWPNKLPVSRVLTLFDNNGNLNDEYTIKVLEKQGIELLGW